MKKLMVFAVVLLTMGLAACSSDNSTSEPQPIKLEPLRASEVAFYSNGNKLDANGQIANAAQNAKYAPFYITRAEGDETPEAVEVNFSINDRQYEANDTKLSIHVRSTSDVTVFIPTTAEYYCPLDDMQIVMAHWDNTSVYGSEEHAEMNVDGNKVELNIAFAENGITITTNGMNAAVQKYLNETYGDGLTFEICNYFNNQILSADGKTTTPLSHQDLKNLLDNKTIISFTNTPKYYASAYGLLNGKGENGEKEVEIEDAEGNKEVYHIYSLDCRVVPADASLFNSSVSESISGNTSYLYTYTRK